MLESRGYVEAEPYTWPHGRSFSPSTTAVVVIDMQRDFCEQGGYLSHQGYDISMTRAIIPNIQILLHSCRFAGYAIFHTREGDRSDVSDLPSRELLRSRNNASGLGIGDQGSLGRLLVRGEAGHDIVHELYPRDGEPVIDKPGKGAFTNTAFDLLLRVKDIKNLIICGVTTDVDYPIASMLAVITLFASAASAVVGGLSMLLLLCCCKKYDALCFKEREKKATPVINTRRADYGHWARRQGPAPTGRDWYGMSRFDRIGLEEAAFGSSSASTKSTASSGTEPGDAMSAEQSAWTPF